MAPVSSSPSRPATSVWVLAGTVVLVVLLSAHLGEAAFYEKLGPYYQHDIVSRPNFTDVITIRGYTRIDGFGCFSSYDDPMTVTPDMNSELVGRIQGVQSVNSLDETKAMMVQTVHFSDRGTLSFVGQFSLNKKSDSRLHIVGGTGEFEGVHRGYFETELYWMNVNTIDAILKVSIYYRKEEKYW